MGDKGGMDKTVDSAVRELVDMLAKMRSQKGKLTDVHWKALRYEAKWIFHQAETLTLDANFLTFDLSEQNL